MAPPEPSALEILRTHSLTSVAGREIERLILNGELAAGSRINEQALADRLGISRGPVREAIRGLERSGLVVTVVNQGSYVRKVSAEEALELYDLRALITGGACAAIAADPPPGALARLKALVAAMAEAAAADDAQRYYGLNLDFHAALLEAGAGPRAQRIYADLGNELHLFRRRALVAPENMRESNREHAAILAALRSGDADAARCIGETHIRNGKRRFATSTPAPENDQRPPQAATGGEPGHERPTSDPPRRRAPRLARGR